MFVSMGNVIWNTQIKLIPVRTESKQESLQNSLMTYMGESASENDLREAFCRDIDAYSFEFDQPGLKALPPASYPAPSGPVTPGYR